MAISGVVDTCSISTGDGWTEGTGKGIRGSNHRRDTVSCFLSYNQGRVPVQPQRWVTHVLRTRDSRIDNRLNLRNEFDSLGIEDFLERTDHHLPYPLRRNRLSALVVAVTFGVVGTCSISTGDGRIWVGRGFVAVITEEDETVSTIDPNETHADLGCVPSRDR